MTPLEARRVLETIVDGAVRKALDRRTLFSWQQHLTVLPYAAVEARVAAHVLRKPWCSCLAEIREAVGVPERCAGDWVRAVSDGGQLVPDLRSVTGWSYVAPHEPLPRGAIEAAAVAAELAAPPAAPPALPAGPAIRGVLLDRDRKIAALIGAKRLPPLERPAPDAAAVEAELAAFDARYQAQATAKEESRA